MCHLDKPDAAQLKLGGGWWRWSSDAVLWFFLRHIDTLRGSEDMVCRSDAPRSSQGSVHCSRSLKQQI
ncbi:hypothetical protein ILYODFUR_000145 [Ilyodon furcidens]|uniref:Uncharacterized protein n=1 Tax=Ilyodon furcidens TaxID=33524 RepID=A0ABV0UP70_9TELE